MHFDIFTLFPGMFQGPFTESILKRAQERGLLSIALHNIRDATTDKHHVVDDYPYGGGAGMVMKPEPIFASIEALYQGGPIILHRHVLLFLLQLLQQLHIQLTAQIQPGKQVRSSLTCQSQRLFASPPGNLLVVA